MIRHLKNFMAMFAIGIVCSACAGPPEIAITEDTLYAQAMPQVEYEYELGPGDVIEIIYHYTPKPDTDQYYLSVGDELKVEFAYHPDFDRKLTIAPDGNITMPRKGAIHVLGLTPSQLQEKLTTLYSDQFKDPIITITMIQYNRAIDHLKKAITTAPRGQSKLTAVRPDGYISFPMIEDIMAKGKTLPELRKDASVEYTKLIDNLTVSCILKVMKANLVYVMGEVAKPDYYLMDGPHTVTQILARAGNVLNTGEKSSILVISRDKNRRPYARLVDLKSIFATGNISQDLILNQYDVVYVPKSKIARRNLFVQQYINGLIPNNLLDPYNLGGTLINNNPIGSSN